MEARIAPAPAALSISPAVPAAMAPDRFAHFVAIDWSGAVGERHAGIALAVAAAGGAAPEIVRPEFAADNHRWSRAEVADWLIAKAPPDALIGVDLGISLPFVDRGAFLPGWSASPGDARGLWALVERVCATDPYLAASSFVDHPAAAPHYRRHGGREGASFGADGQKGGRGRFRETERTQETMGCRPYSNFNLVGAAQVGKSSLTGMRLLHRVGNHVPIWPIDPLPASGSVIVEIYTTIAAMAAGRAPGRSKMRTIGEVNLALEMLGSALLPADFGPAATPIDDHRADAVVTAAWLRVSAGNAQLWQPDALTSRIAQTEGWTFGAR